MKLHKNEELFKGLIIETAQAINLPELYIEKDYWVTHVLKNLSQSEYADDVVFKGGTSLSKAYRIIDRFSEDVDLAIFGDGLSQNGIKNRLKEVEQAAAVGLEYIKGDARESKGSKFRKTIHQYQRVIDDHNFGQVSPELLIEVNSFTRPEPCEKIKLNSYIASALIEAGQNDLIAEHELEEFPVQVLSMKRTLIEKFLGIVKDSYDENPTLRLSARIRHMYDVCLILRDDDNKAFLTSSEFTELCSHCIEDEKELFKNTAHIFDNPLADAPIFDKFEEWRSPLGAEYNGDFKRLVYRDLPHMDEIAETLKIIRSAL